MTTSSDSPASAALGTKKDVHTTASEMQNQLLHEADMNAAQRRRFRYFQQMRVFVTNLTNICERLRFKEKDVRKFFLKRDMSEIYIPPFAYLPLCNSVDEYYCIRKTLPKECHAFTTKARVPALMMFELERHPRSLDVATFLNAELELHADSIVYQRDDQFHANYAGTHGEHISLDAVIAAAGDNDEDNQQVTPLPSAFVDVAVPEDGLIASSSLDAPLGTVTKSGKRCYWSAEGTGLNRLRANTGKTIHNTASRISETANTDDVSLEFDQESKGILAADQSLSHVGVLGETFAGKAHRLQRNSNFGHLPGWSIGGLIAKSNDDVRQEVFVIQLMTYYQRAFAEANIPVWMHTYKIVSTSKSTGLIELIPNSTSLDGLKKSEGYPGKMRLWYEQKFGGIHSDEFKAAIENYIASQAAYSIVTYLLAIKDRHNGNIMIDKDGHVIHIDFGFVFGLAPGKQFSMEKAPWKLNVEFVEVMGGYDSSLFKDYRQRCIQAFIVARRHAKSVLTLMSIMQAHSNYPAFRYNSNAIRDFRARLYLDRPDSDLPAIIDQLIGRYVFI
jgi:phosphatidylinositol 4-kinase